MAAALLPQFLPVNSFMFLIVISFCLHHTLAHDPRAINLREPEHPDFIQAFAQGLVLRYFGNSSSSASSSLPEHFRLLQLDADFLVIGAADAVHNLSLSTFKLNQIYGWEPGEEERHDCQMKSPMERGGLCHNFIRVLGRLSRGRLLICGTNAFRPACRILSAQWEILAELPGIGLAPPDPGQNSSAILTNGDQLYSATVADFAGTDPLLFRRNVSNPNDRGLRTQRGNALMLDGPQFVGTLESEEFIYLFFREDAVEADFQSATYSRVARVCKSDRGGPAQHYGQEWTTFVKARLNCSIGGASGAHGRPFYFDQLIAVSPQVHDGLVYATFVSEFDFLRHSVVCAFRLQQIDALFRSGPYLAYDQGQRRWTRRPRDELTAGLGQCQPESKKMSEDEALARRKYPLMADSVPNALGKAAAGIHRGGDHYGQIAVLPGVRHDAGFSDVLYIATDQGNLVKLANFGDVGTTTINNINNNNNNSANATINNKSQLPPVGPRQSASSAVGDDPLVPVSIIQLPHLPIRRLLIHPPSNALIVVTDSVVYRLPLHFCAFHANCAECLGSRDPHCVWHRGKCQGREEVEKEEKSGGEEEKPMQDVLGRRGRSEQICAKLEGDADKDKGQMQMSKKEERIIIPLDWHNEMPNERNKGELINGMAAAGNCECAVGKQRGKNIIGKCECPPSLAQEQHQLMMLQEETMRKGGNGRKANGNEEEGGGNIKMVAWAGELKALPWWVLLLAILAIMQCLAFGLLCCKWRRGGVKLLIGGGGVNGGGTGKRLHPSCNFSLPYRPSNSGSCGGGLISAYSPASILSVPVGPTELQSDNWTSLSCSSTSPESNRSSSTSPKVSAEFVPANERRKKVAVAVGGRMLQGWSLMPRRASISGGEISVQLEGSAAPSAGLMTLPLHFPSTLGHHHHYQPTTMSTFRR